MSVKNKTTRGVVAVLLVTAAQVPAQMPAKDLKLKTLFTSPEERALIDRNRYRQDPEPSRVKPAVSRPESAALAPAVPMVTVEKEITVSGISISPDGVDVAWINGVMYEDGAKLEDGIRLRISTRDGKIRLRAPNGRSFFARAGETIRITYRKEEK